MKKIVRVYRDNDKPFYTYADEIERAFEISELTEETTKLKKQVFAVLPNFLKFVKKLKKQFFTMPLPKIKTKKTTLKQAKKIMELYEKGNKEGLDSFLKKLEEEDKKLNETIA